MSTLHVTVTIHARKRADALKLAELIEAAADRAFGKFTADGGLPACSLLIEKRRWGRRSRTPLPNPPPQGGREQEGSHPREQEGEGTA
jgi:hypothetical protein